MRSFVLESLITELVFSHYFSHTYCKKPFLVIDVIMWDFFFPKGE